jgi:hypothetical protein
MSRVESALCALAFLLSASLLSSCSPLDIYAFRAIQYNYEAEETQNQVILLNIVRSALHRPMEFTEITNIIGANTGSATTSFSFPVGFRLPTGVTTGTAGGSVGGSTTFTIPVLDTQDFYQGLLNDIQPSLVAYYLQTTFVSKELLLNLFVENIAIHVTDKECEHSHASTCERNFRNSPTSAEDIALFQTFVRYLLSMQVSAEPIKSKPKSQTITANGATININGGSSDTSSGGSGGGGGASKPTPYRLCFNPREPGQGVPPSANCGYPQPKGTDEQIAASTKIDGIPFSRDLATVMLQAIAHLDEGPPCPDIHIKIKTLPHDSLCYEQSVHAFANHKVQITLQFRSTASIFNFIGQLVSAADNGKVYALYASAPFHAYPEDWPPCWMMTGSVCKPIIVVRPQGGTILVSATYDASLFAVPGDPQMSFSPDVFTILKQLIALNLSGKNLPTTAILSVTSTAGP